VWDEYEMKRKEENEKKRRIKLEDMEESWERGIKSINKMFKKERNNMEYDKGWRIRKELKKYKVMKKNKLWWKKKRNDGKLWKMKK
jgi:pre-mRNA-processing factor 8